MLRCNIPPSRASLDLHSTGRNSTCSVVRSEKCFSSIFLAASLILRTSRDTTNHFKNYSDSIQLCVLPPETSPYLTCWCSWWCGLGPSSGQCHAPQRQCVWFQVGCPQVLPPPHTPDGDACHCLRLRTWEGALLLGVMFANDHWSGQNLFPSNLFFSETPLHRQENPVTVHIHIQTDPDF